MRSHLTLTFLSLLLFFSPPVKAQTETGLINRFLQGYVDSTDLVPADIEDYLITDQFKSRHNGVTHIHIRQTYQGIEVYNGTANLTVRNGQVLHIADRLQRNLAQRAVLSQPGLTASQAIESATRSLELGPILAPNLIQKRDEREFLFEKGGISLENIPVKLMYLPGPEDELFLVWDLSIYTLDANHWWSVRIDAQTGALLDQVDWVAHCDFPDHNEHHHADLETFVLKEQSLTEIQSCDAPQYRVLAYYTESPNHGPNTLLIDPADSLASPFGWHDVNGVPGHEYTITRGNNVYASEDRDANNIPGYSPDGDSCLNFDFPFNLNQAPIGYQDAAITNLFYMNNIMHDIWYRYGFDEASGNFQQNNYGRGGNGGDYVNAEAQDGTGTNNANFATPPDGNNPRMQMFLWTGGSGAANLLTVNSPSTVAGTYSAAEATFGPGLPATPLTGDLVLVNDATNPDPEDACDPIVNASALAGKIAVVDRGGCAFVVKVEAAQNAGAIAVIVVNNASNGVIAMGGASNTITIPSIMIALADGIQLKNRLIAGDTVNATLQNISGNFDRDGDLDNGIIAHEYGHGLSIRMTGGPSTSGCLNNDEQMGEGWSDYFGLMLTLDTTELNRGIGTFASNQATSGIGIRPARYSPNFGVNAFTYGATNSTGQISQPHGIGFVWCTMLWDLTHALIDEYGYDPDLYNGTGGNNIAMQLVIDGIKLQPCNPGFVDGRDAILLADQLNNGGANQCLIWEAFARRGLGLSADQGSSQSRTDQVEAFDIPPTCLIPTAAPSAAFSFNYGPDCQDKVFFKDLSTSTPQAWSWDFGDGMVDSIQNPVHTYTSNGTYQVRMIAQNTLGLDTIFQTVTVLLPPGPFVDNTEVCVGDVAALSINGSNIYQWYDVNGSLLQIGNTFQTSAPVNADTTFLVDQAVLPSPQGVGPIDGSFASGGYHNTGFTGTLNFTAEDELTIVSAWLNAGSAGPRTIFLWDGVNGNGNIVDQITITIPNGPQRVNLDLKVPGPGTYSVGGSNVDLFRNNAGANYPYEIPGLLSINSSSATTNANAFYYYLYDWEVVGRACRSERVPVNVKALDADFSYSKDNTGTLVSFNHSATGNDFFWNFGDGDSSLLPNPSHAYLSQGTYVVSLTVNGICSHTDTVEIAYNTGLESLAPGLDVSVSPNPARDQIWITFNQPLAETMTLRLYSPNGKVISNQTLRSGESRKSWKLNGLASGIYLLQLENSRGVHALKVMVRN